MAARPDTDVSRDPLTWCRAIAAAFLALVLHRLTIPSKPYFDEVHYLPAARALLALSHPLNTEHPLLGKELIALGIAAFGDAPLGWRLPGALAGAGALFAAMRALWWASASRPATLLFGALVGTNFMLFVMARIAMLDAFMLAFAMAALWLGARAIRRPDHGRRDLALAGVALGASLASKWSAAPVVALPGLAFAAVRLAHVGPRRWLTARDAAPVRGVSLLEAVLWLGIVPLAVYFATFVPTMLYADDPVAPSGLLDYQLEMARLQSSVVQPHPYQSRWWQWLLDLRPIWFLYEPVDGAQRGVLLVGNPVTMIAGLPALALCLAWGRQRRDAAMLGTAALFAASFGLWLIADKPVQFYYHYLLPGTFLAAALALVLGAGWERGTRWPAWTVLAGALGLFAYFYPILSAGALANDQGFLAYAWLDSWR
ncbi:MAG TPA: phospholipid carrier-dependent glycosyltransferase [Novosphingobium sp.]|nr:phospholipid carrier-dependent glycosyltransferase [Novosphingobium sp.]